MMPRIRACLLIIATLPLVAAAAGADPEELVRQGNAAFLAGDHDKAIALFDQAEERITNPGLVAFNKGAALYRLGRFAQAEAHYRRCLEDASGPRRARMLFDLGNCLIKQSEGNQADLLDQASKCYRMALAGELDDEVRRDAQHNFELARLLWVKAKAQRKPENPGPDNPKDPPKTPDNKKAPEEIKAGGKDKGAAKSADIMQKIEQTKDPKGNKERPIQTNELPPPGKGHLQPVPDREEHVPLPPEDALRHLQRAAELIQRERREHQRRSTPIPYNLMDW